MKFNWGFGIFLAYSSFVAMMVMMVIRSTTVDRDLVVDNYYEEDLRYQSTYERLTNSNALGEPIVFNYKRGAKVAEIRFPQDLQQAQGTVWLYRPNDQDQDLHFPLSLHENTMIIPVEGLELGVWKVEVKWNLKDVAYLNRFSFNLTDSKLTNL